MKNKLDFDFRIPMLPKVQFFFASTPNAAAGADSGTAGAGGGAPGGGGTPPASAPGQGGQPGQGAGSSAIDWKTAPEHFRKEYETLKSKHEPWEKLGVAPDQIGRFQGTYNKVSEQAINVGTQLGYTKDEIIEALEADPVKTIDFLRNQAAAAEEDRAGSGGESDLQSQIDAAIEERFAPIQQRENERMTTEANALFERTVYNEIVNAYKADGVDVANIPEDEKFMLISATSEIMKYDDKALHALKFGGSTASIQKCFQEAKTYLDKYYMARATRERGAVAGGPRKPGAQQQNSGGRRPTLDEMIEEPTLINNKYKVGT